MKFIKTLFLPGSLLLLLCISHSFAQTPSAPYHPNNRLPQWVTDNARKREEMDRRSRKDPVTGRTGADAMARRTTVGPPRQRPGVMTSAERKRMEELLAPHPADLAAYKIFLEQKNTGIFRLFPNPGCIYGGIVRIDGECANFVPDADTYTFRPGGKSTDMTYNGLFLASFGFFSQYLMTDLGDVDITKLLPASPELKFVTEFTPAAELEGARKQFRDLADGIESDGKHISISATPAVNNTYALRIIAYRLGNRTPINSSVRSARTRAFFWLKADKRTDMLVVFRVIRKEDDRNLTIVWKELSRKDPPVIKFAKGEKWDDFK